MDALLSASDIELATLIAQEFEPDERLFAFAKVHEQFSDRAYWLYMKAFYEGMPRPYLINSFIGTLFHMPRPERDVLWNENTLIRQMRLTPTIIRIYRGCWSANDTGWNYYLHEDRARTAAIECPLDGQPGIIVARVHKNEIEYLSDDDVVVVDPRKISVRKVKRVKMSAREEAAAFALLKARNRPDEDDEHARITFLLPIINTYLALDKVPDEADRKQSIINVEQFFIERRNRLEKYAFEKEAKRVGVQIELLKSPTEEVKKWVTHFRSQVRSNHEGSPLPGLG